MDYNKVSKDVISSIKPRMEEVRKLGKDMKDYPNKLDKPYYLAIQDSLSVIFDDILEKYLYIKNLAEDSAAMVILGLKKKYEGTKAPNVSQLEAEARLECTDINMAEALLESYYKAIKNYLQTNRSHIMALSGREENDE